MISGESKPVSRGVNDFIFGSSLNQGSVIYMRVSSVDSQSTVAQIAKLVEKAQMSKAPIQTYADSVARIFTPIILLISIIVFITWAYLAYDHKIPSDWYQVK
jgi:Cu+-exporting ATPase